MHTYNKPFELYDFKNELYKFNFNINYKTDSITQDIAVLALHQLILFEVVLEK